MKDSYKHSWITKKIIRAYYTVYNFLGYGFLEKVYENALALEINKIGLKVEQQKQIFVYYDGLIVGDYFADLVVSDKVIVELKAAGYLRYKHEAQLINYLKATYIEVGLLLNFGKIPELKRKIFTNTPNNEQETDTDGRQ